MPKTIHLEQDPNDQWAQVELYRWQHGNLPGEPGKPELPFSVSGGLRGMADAIGRGDLSNFPSPFNVASVLRYAAALLDLQK